MALRVTSTSPDRDAHDQRLIRLLAAALIADFRRRPPAWLEDPPSEPEHTTADPVAAVLIQKVG